jgi:hypothetical protein
MKSTVLVFSIFLGLLNAQTYQGEWAMAHYFGESYSGHYAAFLHFEFDTDTTGTYWDSTNTESQPNTGNITINYIADGRSEIREEDEIAGYSFLNRSNDIFTFVNPDTTKGQIGIGIRKSSGHSASSLNGRYLTAIYQWLPAEGQQETIKAWIEFDGSGTGIFQPLATSFNGEIEPDTFQYVIEDNGTFIVDNEVYGILSPDEEIFAMHLNDTEFAFGLGIGIKESSGNTDALIDGQYAFSEFRGEGGFGDQEENHSALWVGLDFAGNGNAEVLFADEYNQEIVGESLENFYSIAPNGEATLFQDPKTSGMASGDGNLMVYIDYSDSNSVAMGIFNKYYDPAVSVAARKSPVPQKAELLANYPNPFNPSTTIPFRLRESGHVEVSIFNVLGQNVARVLDQPMPAGAHKVLWETAEKNISSNIYFIQLRFNGQLVRTQKTILIK